MVQASKQRLSPPRQDYVTPDPAALLRRLVDQLPSQHAAEEAKVLRRSGDVVEEILLEVDIDGTRYVLARSQPQPQAERVSLSPRELAIAQLIAKGLPNKCIGDILEISQWTVATHLRRIFAKLGVASRAAMVARLLEENLL